MRKTKQSKKAPALLKKTPVSLKQTHGAKLIAVALRDTPVIALEMTAAALEKRDGAAIDFPLF